MATRVAGRHRGASKKQRPRWVKYVKRTLAVGSLFFFIGGSFGGFFFITEMKKAAEKIKDLPERLRAVSDSRPSLIYASDGKTILYRAAPVYRRSITNYDEIPKLIRYATLAAEDKRFFSHDGVDYWAAGRSLVANVREQRAAQGGSTITMQLCKRLYTSSEKTFSRKVGDVCMAIQMERMVTKEEILRNYLNEIFYGQGAYGIVAAADVYFGKRDLHSLSVSEVATLVRLVRRPSEENPFVDKEKAMYNRDVVLKVMLQEGWINQQQYDKAKADTLPNLRKATFAGGDKVQSFPYFTHYVLDYLKENLPDIDIKQGGYKIYTTLDPVLQKEAEAAVAKTIANYRRRKVHTGAFVLMDNTGQILAMQGGLDYKRNQFNAVYQGGRQPGSSMKPFIYAAALSVGAISPGDRISNEPFEMKDGRKVWRPQNSSGRVGGSFSIQDAIKNSHNIPAVWVTSKVGPDVAAKYCRDVFGFESKIDPVMSMALGVNDVTPLEMASGYSVFMMGGDRVEPRPVTRIVGPDGQTVRTFKPNILKNQLDPSVAHLMDGYLRAVVTSGTGHEAQSVSDSRGKTGTTQENKDAWFCGYTNNLVGIAWIANETFDEKRKTWVYSPMNSSVFGGTVAIDIWKRVMKTAQNKYGRGAKIEGDPMSRDIGLSITNRQPERDENPEETPVTPPRDEQAPDRQPEQTEPVRNDPPVEEVKPPRTESRPPRNEERSENMVSVEVCAGSGLKATIYCPETNTRTYASGNAPRRWCRMHGN